MKTWIAIVLLGCMLLGGCAGTSVQATVQTSLPSAEPSPTPQSLTPELLLQALYDVGEPYNEVLTKYVVPCAAAAAVLESYGEKTLSALLRTRSGPGDNVEVDTQTLFYQGSYATNTRERAFAAIVFNGYREGWCLIMENMDGWKFTGCFSCGEIATVPDDEVATGGRLSIRSAQTLQDGVQTWLLAPGKVESGTGIGTYDCVWYNLGACRVDLRYYTSLIHVSEGDALRYRIRGSVSESTAMNGELALNVQYDYRFAVAPEGWWDGEGDDQSDLAGLFPETYEWTKDGFVFSNANQTLRISENAYLMATQMTNLCWPDLSSMLDHGTKAQKAWVRTVQACARDEIASRVTLAAQGKEIMAEQIDTPASVSSMAAAGPVMKLGADAAVTIGFVEKPEYYTLTVYDEHNIASTVPVDNGVFLTPKTPGVWRYSLAATWLDEYAYAFTLRTTAAQAGGTTLPQDAADAIARGRDYAKQITGYDYALANGEAVYMDFGGIEEWRWDVSLTWPHTNLLVNMRFDQAGELSFFALFTNGAQRELYTWLPLSPAPADALSLSYPEAVAHWLNALPIERPGDLTKVEIIRKEVPGQYNGRRLTRMRLRFSGGSVILCEVEQETRRLCYLCLYPPQS